MKRRNLILTVLILALVLSAGIGSAWAYFTTYATARGGISLELGYQTELEEHVTGAQKVVDISYDTEDGQNSQEVYVRARAYGPDDEKYPLEYVPGAGWEDGLDGWWYYTTPLGPENLKANSLTVNIHGLTETAGVEEPKNGDSINVVVVYECAPVLYQRGPDGTVAPVPARDPSIWEQKLIVEGAAPEGGE